VVDEVLHGLVERRLRQSSQRYTTGRREVVELLARAGCPVSIDAIEQLAPRLPRSSAYRHLADLEQAGVVRRVAASDGFSRFELAEDITDHHHHHHHHHRVCTRCGKMIDATPTPAFAEATRRYLAGLASSNGFAVDNHRLDVLGACAACQEGSGMAAPVPTGQDNG
jgi:Fe2+ or Zn2+ uptake regulation protein